MRKLIITAAAFVAAGSLWAETKVWTKTDEFENLNGDASSYWNNAANWEGGTAPQNGDSLSFSKTPDAGVERISAVVPGWGQYVLDTISGLSVYNLTLSRQSRITVNDLADFQGIVRVGANRPRNGAGYDGYPAFVKLMATADHVPVINNYDDCFHSAVFVPDAGTKAEIRNVVHSAPGALRKHGSGELEATFAVGCDQKVYVENGQLTVRATDQTTTLGQAVVGPWQLEGDEMSNPPSLGVKAGETVRIGTVVANGGTLTVKGAGTLQVGTLVKRDDTGKNDVAGKVNVALENGGFGNLPAQPVDTTKMVSKPFIHLDASAADVFTFDADDPTLVATWADPVSGRTATGAAGTNGGGRLPKLVENGLNGMPVLDFGTATDVNHTGDGTSGYVAFDEVQTVRAAFLVYRRKDLTVATPFLGGNEEWKCQFWGYKDVPAALLAYDGEGNPVPGVFLGDARIDGAAIDVTKYQFSDTDFHVVSLTIAEDRHDWIGNNGTSYVGAAPYYSQFGGIDLAEAIIYDAPLAEGERAEIEKRLLAKWLPAKSPATARTTEIGTMTFAGDMRVTADQPMTVDSFSGDGVLVKDGASSLTLAAQMGVSGVDVKAGALAFAVKGSSGGEPEIMKSAWYRMDPSDESTLTKDLNGRVTKIADANGGTSYFERSYLFECHPDDWSSHVAGPSIVAAEKTGLNLLDFGPYQPIWQNYPESVGMDLVVNGVHISHDQHWVDAARTAFVRTVVVVVEKTGGGSDGYQQAFVGGRLWSKFSTTNGMLCNNKNDESNLSTWYFDGNPCDPTNTPWATGGLHVIACSYPSPANDLPVHLLAQENDKDMPDHMGGLRYGEVLLFKEALSPADLREVALYLKEKWLGAEKDTSMGFSQVSVAAGASCAITGDITIADNSTVTIGTAKSGAGTMTVSGTVTIGKNVAVVIPDGRGSVPLVKAAAFDGEASLATWTLNGKRFRYSIRADGTLCAECGNPGLVILVH